jgi:hypothetical protein
VGGRTEQGLSQYHILLYTLSLLIYAEDGGSRFLRNVSTDLLIIVACLVLTLSVVQPQISQLRLRLRGSEV